MKMFRIRSPTLQGN